MAGLASLEPPSCMCIPPVAPSKGEEETMRRLILCALAIAAAYRDETE
jgi:hypothetical protein